MRSQELGPYISELELEFLLQAQRLQKVNYPKYVQIAIIVHLGYKRLMATMAELIAIEHTHETAVPAVRVPPSGSQTAVRLSLGVTSL